MKGDKRVSFIDEHCVVPSPVTTEEEEDHDSSSSNEGEIAILGEKQSDTVETTEELSLTKHFPSATQDIGLFQDGLHSIIIPEAASHTTTMSSSSKDSATAIVEAEEKKMECEGEKASESEMEVASHGTGLVDFGTDDRTDSQSGATYEGTTVAGTETLTECGGENHEKTEEESSSKIDPDGSTACLSQSRSAHNKPSENSEGKNIATQIDQEKAEETTFVAEGTDRMAAKSQKEEEGTQEVAQANGATTNGANAPMATPANNKDRDKQDSQPAPAKKEAIDAPSAASVETASTIEDKDDQEEGEDSEQNQGVPREVSMAETGAIETAKHQQPENSLEMDEDASGRIVRTNSHPTTLTAKAPSSTTTTTMEAGREMDADENGLQASDTNDAHSSSNSKRPMDASGRCSLDLEVQQRVTLECDEVDPVGGESTDRVDESASNGHSQSSYEAQTKPLTSDEHGVENELQGLPTPAWAVEKEASDAAIMAATQPEEVNVSQQQSPQLTTDLLANRDKEGFGLLARGESFKGTQQQEGVVAQRRQSNHRVPQDPAAAHKRENSAVASHSRRNSACHEYSDNMQRVPDENANMLLDDNSWRPSQISYPSSPSMQGLPAPQAIPLNNGGYMVMPPPQMPQMPHHPGQPQHSFIAPPPAILHHQSSFHSQQQLRPSYSYQAMTAMAPIPSPNAAAPGGKRKIRLKLQEEILARPSHLRRASFFFGGRSTRKLMMSEPLPEGDQVNEVDRGTITVSWFEGTSSIELQEHVNRSVERKLKLDKGQQLDDIRILDTKVDPPEEIVLCPYIPSGSEFVLRYKLKPVSGRASPTFYGPPDSPSAAPSPHPSHGNLGSLDEKQLAVLRRQLDAVQEGERRKTLKYHRTKGRGPMTPINPNGALATTKGKRRSDSPKDSKGGADSDTSDGDNESDTLQPQSSVDAKLAQITELLLMDRQKQHQRYQYPQVEKRQVVFVLANYFVLFVAFITILAEMQARAPNWLKSIESQLENVQTCSADQEALFKCVSNGEFAGLFATVILWLSRSATTKQIFLLGFDSPQKLWTVFYESLVGAFCWGVSYMFIRRGMNPDTRPQFLQKYWKDAVYGSLAGFNATFMKAVLKNLIPREAVEEAFNDRQLKILSWLPTFS